MLKKVKTRDLAVGMYIERYGDGSWDFPMMEAGYYVRSPEEIHALAVSGVTEVFIDTARSLPESLKRLEAKESDPNQPPPPFFETNPVTTMAEELPLAEKLYARGVEMVSKTYTDAKMGVPPNMEEVRSYCGNMLQSIARNEYSSVCLAAYRRHKGYLLTHQLNVCLYSMIMGIHLGLGKEDLLDLGSAAMVHDLGKALFPTKILAKPGPLSSEELTRARRHVHDGYKLVKASDHLDESILRGVLDHHERHDGSGYPYGVTGEHIETYPKIIGLADVYDALTSDRGYSKSITPLDALSRMYARRGRDFDPKFMEIFIKTLGIFPAGSLVRISDGRLAVVESVNHGHPLRPVVMVVLSEHLKPVQRQRIDLSSMGFEDKSAVRITDCLDPSDMGVDVYRLLS